MSLFQSFQGLAKNYTSAKGNAVFMRTLEQVDQAINGDAKNNGRHDWQPVTFFLCNTDTNTDRAVKAVITYVTNGGVEIRGDAKAKWKFRPMYKQSNGKKVDPKTTGCEAPEINATRMVELRNLAFRNEKPASIFGAEVSKVINGARIPPEYNEAARAKSFAKKSKENKSTLANAIAALTLAWPDA